MKKILLALCLALMPAIGQADIIISRYDSGVAATAGASGAADPTAGTGVDNWTVFSAGAFTGYNGAFDTGNGGLNLVDGTSGGRYSYADVFTAAEQAELALGWEATFTLALNHDAVDGAGPTGVDNYYNSGRTGAQVFYVDVAGSRTILSFAQDGSGNVTVNNQTIDTGGGDLLQESEQIGTGAPFMDFATFNLAWTPDAGVGTASLSDNFGNNYSISSSANSGTNIVFGSGTTGGQGSAVWNRVQLNAVPEPNSLALVSIGLVGLVARRRRK